MTNASKWALTALVCGMTVGSYSTVTADETTWRVSIWGERRTSSEPLEWYAKEVEAKTGGQMKMRLTYGGDKPNVATDQIKSGAFEGAFFCSSYFSDKLPLLTVMELPMFGPENMSVLGRVELALADHPAIRAELRKWNVKMLVPLPQPQYQIMGTRRIARIDDLRGAKIRMSADMGKIFQDFGATTLHMTGKEGRAALKNGTLDAYITSYPAVFADHKIYETSKYVTDNISLGTQLCYLGVSQKAWDTLPAKTQQVMQDLRPAAISKYEEIYAREKAEAIPLFKQHGIEFVSFSPADRARLIAKAIKHWQAWIEEREKQGLKGREVFEFVQAKIREYGRK